VPSPDHSLDGRPLERPGCRGPVSPPEAARAELGTTVVPRDDYDNVRESGSLDRGQYGTTTGSGRFAVIIESAFPAGLPGGKYVVRGVVELAAGAPPRPVQWR